MINRTWAAVRIGVLGGAAALLLISVARADEIASYLDSARQYEKARNWRGAEIELRNATQGAPSNGALRIELAKVYLAEGNANAAEAELFAAHLRGAKDEQTAALTAQAMLELGEFGDLLKNVPAARRPPRIESVVRSYRGMAAMSLNDFEQARAMFADAERLDPKATLPLVGETRMLLQQHQLDAAWRKAEEALKRDPHSGDALDAEGVILAMQGHSDAALKRFGYALWLDPRDVRVLIDRADLELGHANFDAAQKDVTALGKTAPRNAMSVYLQAVIDAGRGRLLEADAMLDKLRGMAARFPQAYLVAAEVKFRLNQLDQAQQLVTRFIAQLGDDPRAYKLLGAIALKRGNTDAGISALEKAARLAPNDASTLAALGEAYIARGDLDKARETFGAAAVKAPGNAPIATARALTEFATGNREASVTALASLFQGGKGSMIAGPPLVIEALQVGELDVAEAAARQLVAHDSANPTYEELLGVVRSAQHDYAGAESLFRGLLAKHPELASARRDLAQVYLITGRAPDAKALYRERLRAKPDDVTSLSALADIAVREGDDAGAIALLTQAQNVTSADPRPSLQIVSILEGRKKWPEAIGRARGLQAKFPKDPAVADGVGHVLWAAGDHAGAVNTYKAAVIQHFSYAPLFAHYAGLLATDKHYAAAAPLALRAAQLDPRNAALRRDYVTLVYLDKGADAALSASLNIVPDKNKPVAAILTADVLAANSNELGAISLLEKTQAVSASDAIATRLAALYDHERQYAKSLALLQPWVAAHPDDAEARFALAQTESTSGRLGDALVQYEWLAAKRPDNPVVLNNLAWLYDWKHDPRALSTAETALRLAPASGSIADTLGWIMAEQGDAAGATKYLSQASASQPADATIQYHYAVVLSRTGNQAEARSILQKLLSSKGSGDTFENARTLLASLGVAR